MVSRQDIYCQRGKYSHYLTLHIIFCAQNVGKMFSPCHLGLGFKILLRALSNFVKYLYTISFIIEL